MSTSGAECMIGGTECVNGWKEFVEEKNGGRGEVENEEDGNKGVGNEDMKELMKVV